MLSFCVWRPSLSGVSSRLFMSEHGSDFPSFMKAERYCNVCIHHVFIHSFMHGHLGCFCPSVLVNMGVQICVASLLSVPGYILRSGVAGSGGNSVFNILRGPRTVSTEAAPFYIRTNSAQGFRSFCLLSNALFFVTFCFLKE